MEADESIKKQEIEDLKKIKKVLIQVSKNVYRDLEFFYQADNKEQRRRIYSKEVEYDPDNSYAIVCKTLCEIIKEICVKKYKLNIELIKCDTDEFGHTDLLYTAPNGHKYIINCLSDLERIQFGMQMKRFARERYFDERYLNQLNKDEFYFLSDEEDKQIDKSIGYYKYMYMDEFFELLKKEFDDLKTTLLEDSSVRRLLFGHSVPKDEINKLTLEQLTDIKLRFLFNFCNQRRGLIGHIELVRMHKLLSKILFSKEELKKIQVSDCFFNRKDNEAKEEIWQTNEKRVRFLKYKIDGKIYIITTVGNTYLQMTEEEYEEFKKNNNVHEKNISRSGGVLTEYIRNKGVGVNILKHVVVRKKIRAIDNLVGKATQEEIDKIIKQIQENVSNTIVFEVKGKKIEIVLDKTQVDITIDGEHFSYRFENDALIEKTEEGSFAYHWVDEGQYSKKRIIENKDEMLEK